MVHLNLITIWDMFERAKCPQDVRTVTSVVVNFTFKRILIYANRQLWLKSATERVLEFPFKVAFVLQIATQIAVLIAKVARLDCPRQWPELIPILLESVKIQDSLQQHRALLTFYHVTKTLASKRLATDRRLFQDVSRALMLLTFICVIFCATFFLRIAPAGQGCYVSLFLFCGKRPQSGAREMKLVLCR